MNVISKNKYLVPLEKSDITSISRDPETHTGMDENAIDYSCPEGSKVYAAAAGKLIFIKDDSKDGGDSKNYEDFKFYNHIVIKHSNGEYTEYGHLKHNSSLKRVGDSVRAFEPIAVSGNTGYSSEPHLHFSVFVLDKMPPDFDSLPKDKKYFVNDPDLGFQTIEPIFA